VDRRIHYFEGRVHSRKVVLLGKGMEVVYMKCMVLGSIDVGIVVALWIFSHNGHKDEARVIGDG